MELDARLVTFVFLWHGIFCHALIKREPAKVSKWSKLCALSEKLDNRLVSLAGKIENLRTTCMCALNPNMDEKIANIEVELDDMRNGCICGTEMKCPNGWQKFQDSCYFHGTEKVTWHDAKKKCEDAGGYLAEVQSEPENEFILQLWPKDSAAKYGPWLGASDEGTEGKWIWAKSGEALDYTKWLVHTKEPNGGTGENCLHTRQEFDWNDSSCRNNYSYICEKDI